MEWEWIVFNLEKKYPSKITNIYKTTFIRKLQHNKRVEMLRKAVYDTLTRVITTRSKRMYKYDSRIFVFLIKKKRNGTTIRSIWNCYDLSNQNGWKSLEFSKWSQQVTTKTYRSVCTDDH